jgi:hypothetical protein
MATRAVDDPAFCAPLWPHHLMEVGDEPSFGEAFARGSCGGDGRWRELASDLDR